MSIPETTTKANRNETSGDQATAKKCPLVRLGDLRAAMVEDAERRKAARDSGQAWGAVTGFPELDHQLGGILAPGLHFVNGGPGVGKTAFALQVAAQCQRPALFITCEMSPRELLHRSMARVSGEFLGHIKGGTLSGEQIGAMIDATAKAIPDLVIMDASGSVKPGAKDIANAARDVLGLYEGQYGEILIVIDSLHSWAMARPDIQGVEYDRLNDSIGQLSAIGQERQIPVMVITERNRAAMKEGGMHSGAGTRRIEYQGESVISLDVSGETFEKKTIKLSVDKNRHGMTGEIGGQMSFDGALQRFSQ